MVKYNDPEFQKVLDDDEAMFDVLIEVKNGYSIFGLAEILLKIKTYRILKDIKKLLIESNNKSGF